MAVLFSKSPGEHLTITFDWTVELAINATTIAAASFTLPAGLTQVSSTFNNGNKTSTLVLTGGTAGLDYAVKGTITTAETPAKTYEQGVLLAVSAPLEQPSNCYASVHRVATELGLSSAEDIAQLAGLLDSASRYIEEYCGRVFYYRTGIVEKVQARSLKFLNLENAPVVAIASISFDGTTMDAANYELFDAAGGVIRALDTMFTLAHWSNDFEPYVITYSAGYKLPGQTGRNLPSDIEYAAGLIAKAVWNARERDPSIKRMSIPQVIDMEFYNTQATASGQTAEFFQGMSMLKKYKKVTL